MVLEIYLLGNRTVTTLGFIHAKIACIHQLTLIRIQGQSKKSKNSKGFHGHKVFMIGWHDVRMPLVCMGMCMCVYGQCKGYVYKSVGFTHIHIVLWVCDVWTIPKCERLYSHAYACVGVCILLGWTDVGMGFAEKIATVNDLGVWVRGDTMKDVK